MSKWKVAVAKEGDEPPEQEEYNPYEDNIGGAMNEAVTLWVYKHQPDNGTKVIVYFFPDGVKCRPNGLPEHIMATGCTIGVQKKTITMHEHEPEAEEPKPTTEWGGRFAASDN